MRRTKTAAMAGLVAVILVIGIAVAHEPFGGPQKFPGQHQGGGFQQWDKVDKLADEIGLNDEQVEKIKEIRTTMAKDIADLKAEEEKAEIDLKNIMDDPAVPSSDIEKAVKKVLNLENEMKLRKMEGMLAIRDVLTVEQRTQIRELIREKMEQQRELRRSHPRGIQGEHPCGKHGK
ncbi:hypothetical protein DRQ33_01910 [bacterium]|nr:MAG: hypothetical protein DRQ33_01910 [bacterium]